MPRSPAASPGLPAADSEPFGDLTTGISRCMNWNAGRPAVGAEGVWVRGIPASIGPAVGALIYKARYVLPMADDSVMENGEVLVRGGEITAVGLRLSDAWPGEEVRDLGSCALLPGFVNAHSHIEPTLRRNRADGLNLWDWLGALGFRGDQAPSTEQLRFSAMLGAAECALSGITCLGDSSFSGAAAEALAAVGVRGVVFLEVFGQSMGEAYPEMLAAKLDLARAMQEAAPSTVTIGISPHSVYTSNRGLLELCARECERSGLPVAIHAAETEAEAEYLLSGSGPLADSRRLLGYDPMVAGTTPVTYLGEAGLLRPGVCLAHCVHLSDHEIDIVSRSGVGVAHCARSNAYLGAGVAPLTRLLAAGAAVGLGTDSAASCTRTDFFEEMRFAVALQRAVRKEAAALTAKEVLRVATIGGAVALGLADSVGSLEPGKRADMVALSTNELLPGEDIWLGLISRSPADVVCCVVDGAEVVTEGRLANIDISECRARLTEDKEKLG